MLRCALAGIVLAPLSELASPAGGGFVWRLQRTAPSGGGDSGWTSQVERKRDFSPLRSLCCFPARRSRTSLVLSPERSASIFSLSCVFFSLLFTLPKLCCAATVLRVFRAARRYDCVHRQHGAGHPAYVAR
jgi:hypothetical protein